MYDANLPRDYRLGSPDTMLRILATDMVAVRTTGPMRMAVVAAPAYLARYGHPLRAAIDGVGITYTLQAQVQLSLRSGQLVRILEEFSPSFEGFLLGYPSHRQVSAALRAFLEMVRETERSRGAMSGPRTDSRLD
jgi:DNA-binding transcriptional LysR family regulator